MKGKPAVHSEEVIAASSDEQMIATAEEEGFT